MISEVGQIVNVIIRLDCNSWNTVIKIIILMNVQIHRYTSKIVYNARVNLCNKDSKLIKMLFIFLLDSTIGKKYAYN